MDISVHIVGILGGLELTVFITLLVFTYLCKHSVKDIDFRAYIPLALGFIMIGLSDILFMVSQSDKITTWFQSLPNLRVFGLIMFLMIGSSLTIFHYQLLRNAD